MPYIILVAVLESGGRVQQIAKTFGVDWPHLVAQIISFSIVCALLYKFAYRPILKMLEERRQQIALGLANVEKIKAELARTESHRHEVMLEAGAQAAKLIEEARGAIARMQEQETQKAVVAAQQIVTKSREAAERDYTRMLSELRQEVGGLVVQTTAMITGKVLTQEDQRRLAEETAKQLMS